MKNLSLFSGRELMSVASFARCKFSYIPVPTSMGKNEGKPFFIAKSKEKECDYSAIDTAENEGWPIAPGSREVARLSKEGATSSSGLPKIKKALENFKDYLCGVKKRSPDNGSQTTYTPKGKDEKPGFSRPPYID
ncbi:hypothetical protein FZZ93_04325 [Halomonas eurihalina]|uniref:Uncharacterized protein n=1 Tax=Halomonas eurihalina TaxID=42566 RepID=A0A5D9DDH1_HALER|nr:hypothetical protein [Halomonas eurihalina]MDR5858513.1 hypothetical protein [Halomonas eurihalina]TZG40705.1 hypothetical protein FZZ93_04325 [Halomonas eurihalina]